MFEQNVDHARSIVDSVITNQNITQAQYVGMVDLVFNTGGGDFIHSNMVKDVNAGDFSSAATEFEYWNAQGSKGLDTRRANEENMFNYSGSGDPGEGYSYESGIHTDIWKDDHDPY